MEATQLNDFEYNESIIWDSGFGYEVGHFIGEGNSYYTYLIDINNDLCSYPKNEVFKLTEELVNKLSLKYGH